MTPEEKIINYNYKYEIATPKEIIKKHKHEEPKACGHKRLKHCPVCEVVYCEDCGKEWGSGNCWTWLNEPCGSGTTTWHYTHI